jgi:hypothetical protein
MVTATTTVATRFVISASRTMLLSRTDVFIVVTILSGVVVRSCRLRAVRNLPSKAVGGGGTRPLRHEESPLARACWTGVLGLAGHPCAQGSPVQKLRRPDGVIR